MWPAGTSASEQGTIDWAGGMIDWEDPYFTANSLSDALFQNSCTDIQPDDQFKIFVESISVTCADNPSPNQLSYVYTSASTPQIPVVELSELSPVIEVVTTQSAPASSVSASQSAPSATEFNSLTSL